MAFKRYAVLITIASDGKDYYCDRLITARTYKEACKVAKKLAYAADKEQRKYFANVCITEIKILEE